MLYVDAQKPRSQALSIARAAALMLDHERTRGERYQLCFVARIDLVFGAPVLLDGFAPPYLWFAEHCCMNAITDGDYPVRVAAAAVRSFCSSAPYLERLPNTSSLGTARRASLRASDLVGWARKRVVGACLMSQYSGGRPSPQEDQAYFLMDWWFAAAPDVVASWATIDREWTAVEARLRQLRAHRVFSHYVWPVHVHDFLNATSAVRFKAGVRANLVRSVAYRLRTMRPGQLKTLGEFVTDAVGGCDVLINHGRTVESSALLEQPLPHDLMVRRNLGSRYAPMAHQCAAARLAEPVVCCGQPRDCGRQSCEGNWAATSRSFAWASAGSRSRTKSRG